VRHPNIVNFIGISKRMGASPRNKDKEIIYIVTEWVPHGNLHVPTTQTHHTAPHTRTEHTPTHIHTFPWNDN
jgi:hypothetical protein